jgi:hypothetical protein
MRNYRATERGARLHRQYERKARAEGRRARYEWPNPPEDPEKKRVRHQTEYAITTGRLVPEPCLFCDAEIVEAHHHDYSQPLVVTWLCRAHHAVAHRKP